MSKKKYDTNPLDHDAKRKADQRMGIVDEDSATAELPAVIIPEPRPNPSESQTREIGQPVAQPPATRGTAGSGFNPPTRAANPMTRAELQSQGTGPAYLPPSNDPIPSPGGYPSSGIGAQPNYQSGPQRGPQPGYQPNYQSNYQSTGYNPQYPPQYAPVSPGARPQVPYGMPFQNKGLGLDPNIESALCYVPYLGWIMGVLVMAKEPKTNMFARFHGYQSLMLHAGMVLLGLVFKVLSIAGLATGDRVVPAVLGGIHGLIGLGAFFGFIFLGIMAFQMKTIKVPYISDFVEKHNL